jgi:hypothetical protein
MNNNKIIKTIKIHPFNSSIEKYIKDLIISDADNDYNDMSDIKVDSIMKILKKKYKLLFINLKKSYIKTVIKSIRHSYINEKIMVRHKKLVESVKNLYELFSSNGNIISLSKTYDFAPLMIVRQILKYLGFNKETIKSLLKDPTKITDKSLLSLRDEIIFIQKNELDVFSQIDKTQSEKNAIDFENQLGTLLTNASIKYKTQEELSKIQIAKYGHAVNTPDFLIKSDFVLNGKRINWIDAKNFYGANSWFIKFSIQKQIKKYNKQFGYGAIVFSRGFSSGLKIHDVMLIDYDSFLI